ncbi:hypothetical protein [Candidatus Poriferisocius sp.]|uniref:hypothetical protein n=1 Tax=Candidatus Poriferisocius sp. TaxID=3101276 RepID=UPI003B5A79B0
MVESATGADFPPGGVVADSRYYSSAVEALRSACAHIGEAADAVQRSQFFAQISDWDDEANATAHDADKAAVVAMAEALRAKQSVAVYADAARRTLAEVNAAYAATVSPGLTPAPPAPGDPGAAGEEPGAAGDVAESATGEAAGSVGGYSVHLAGALATLAEEQDTEAGRRAGEQSYVKMAQSLSVLVGGRTDYQEIDEALVMLDRARTDYQQASTTVGRTALAGDVRATLSADIRMSAIGEFRRALTALAVARTAYNAAVADHLWSDLAEIRANHSAAATTMFEFQSAIGDDRATDDPYAASAFTSSLEDPDAPTSMYDAARDAAIDMKKLLLEVQNTSDAVDALLLENRAVAADALIEARAVVGVGALDEIHRAYDVAREAMDSLFGARAAFEVGLDLALPEDLGYLTSGI